MQASAASSSSSASHPNTASLPLYAYLNPFTLLGALFTGAIPPEHRDPTLAAALFRRDFEESYGPVHPVFIEDSYNEAIRAARSEFKFLIVYLHSSLHTDTPSFCRNVLASETFADFVNDNMLFWGGDVRMPEPYKVCSLLGASSFPFMAVLCNIDGTVSCLARYEGAMDTMNVMSQLASLLEERGPLLVAARAAVEEREQDRLIREEQDLAYQESLLRDQERERQLREEAERKEREERALLEAERQEEEEARRAEEARQQLLAEKQRRLPPEPAPNSPTTAKIVIRLPDGVRMERLFHWTDTVQSLYDFVDVSQPENVRMGEYYLMSNFPRKAFTDESLTLRSAGIDPQSLLFVQPH
ncbi:FAS-associated factor 2 [Balamuthia mandrillaris]